MPWVKEAIVTDVEPDSPAMRAGLRNGDRIAQINKTRVAGRSGRTLLKIMHAIEVGDVVEMTVQRSDKTISLRLIAAAD